MAVVVGKEILNGTKPSGSFIDLLSRAFPTEVFSEPEKANSEVQPVKISVKSEFQKALEIPREAISNGGDSVDTQRIILHRLKSLVTPVQKSREQVTLFGQGTGGGYGQNEPFTCIKIERGSIVPNVAKTTKFVNDLVRTTDVLCRYCMKRLAVTVDHFWPRALGGCNHAHNLIGACEKCNFRKGSFFIKDPANKLFKHKLHLPRRFLLPPEKLFTLESISTDVPLREYRLARKRKLTVLREYLQD